MASTPTPPVFRHKPLLPYSIRLFHIDPGDYEDKLTCSIVEYDPRSRHLPVQLIKQHELTADNGHEVYSFDYVALSYTWGPEHPTREILVDGLPFPIRENLWEFLRELRDANRDNLFWADAICIAQDDIDEKNAQVAMMGAIFHWASAVFVWLGLEDHFSPFMMLPLRVMNFLLPKDVFFGIRKQPSALEQLAVWEGILSFCRRPYWKRAWIVQEIALARGEVYLFCGPMVARYGAVTACIEMILGENHQYNPEVAPHKREQNNIARQRISEILAELSSFKPPQLTHRGGTTHSLGDLLVKHADTECSDPRDKSFAFINIAVDVSREQASRLIDYSKSVVEVFFDTLMLHSSFEDDPSGISLPEFGRILMQSMSLSAADVESYLQAQEDRQLSQFLQAPRIPVFFENLGPITSIQPFMCPLHWDNIPHDLWVTFDVPCRDHLKNLYNSFRGIAEENLQIGDYVHVGVGSDLALVIRHQDGVLEIVSWAIVSLEPIWTPTQANLTTILKRRDGHEIGQFEAFHGPRADFLRLTFRSMWIMRVRLPVIAAIIQGIDQPRHRQEGLRQREGWDSSLSLGIHTPNWRGYEWPSLFWVLQRMKRRWNSLMDLVQRLSLRVRHFFHSQPGRRSISPFNAGDCDIIKSESESFAPTLKDESIFRNDRPLIDESTRRLADVFQRSAERARFRAGSILGL